MDQIRKALAGQKNSKAKVSLLLQMLGAEIQNSAGDAARSRRLAQDLMRFDTKELGELFDDSAPTS